MKKPSVDVRWRTDGQTAGEGSVAVVADVLRASTNIITAFSMGAGRCIVTTEVEHARRLAKQVRGTLIGERDNRKIEGFDYGNSPVELGAAELANSTIVFTSTNFPHALAAAEKASRVLIGALVNLSAACELAMKLARDLEADICIMPAGEPREKHAGEDYYFAGRAAGILSGNSALDGSAVEAMRAMDGRRERDIIEASVHAQELIADGFAEDVEFAFTVDRFDVVPRVADGWIVV